MIVIRSLLVALPWEGAEVDEASVDNGYQPAGADSRSRRKTERK